MSLPTTRERAYCFMFPTSVASSMMIGLQTSWLLIQCIFAPSRVLCTTFRASIGSCSDLHMERFIVAESSPLCL
ncbi:hypothetical protein BDV97DRAFT_191928 [Delphinella strobiligena]|nr:hypothetical protein BDV97DRAFT_191928 [Delphinella strobiligena]